MPYSASASRLALIALLVVAGNRAAGAAENLLANPGAEEGEQQQPAAWFAASAAAEGLQMRRSSEHASAGDWSLEISNRHQYGKPVSNNWRQLVAHAPVGKTVQLRAHIRTEDAQASNLCVQCWDDAGKTLLAFSSTPVFRGDRDWTETASPPVAVPADAAQIVVRAALTGTGRVWFDDVQLLVVSGSENRSAANRGAPSPAAETGQSEKNTAADTAADEELQSLLPGRVVGSRPVVKDCMILHYLPTWNHGRVDNIAVADNDGGVRTLLAWAPIARGDALNETHRFYLSLYSRKTTLAPPAGELQIRSLSAPWDEETSWLRQPPLADVPPAVAAPFVPGDGWKVFDVTAIVRHQAEAPMPPHGVMLGFSDEQQPATANEKGRGRAPSSAARAWSGYQFVSREGAGQWSSRRPMLVIVETEGPSVPIQRAERK